MDKAMITVTVSGAREKIAGLFGQVQYGREGVTILKPGKPVAVMISVEAMAYYEALEDAELAKMGADAYAEYLANPGAAMSLEDYVASTARDGAA